MRKPKPEGPSSLIIDWEGLANDPHQQRKKELGFVDFTEVETLTYPTFFTAKFDYFATAEGNTIGIVMGYARTASELRNKINDHFNTYYAQGAEIWPRLQVPPGAEALLPDVVKAMVTEPSRKFGAFHFSSTFHINLS